MYTIRNDVFERDQGDSEIRIYDEHSIGADFPSDACENLACSLLNYAEKNRELITKILLKYTTNIVEWWGIEEVEEAFPEVRTLNAQNCLAAYGGISVFVEAWEDEMFAQLLFNAPYDQEHGLHIDYVDGKFDSINDFKIKLSKKGEISLV